MTMTPKEFKECRTKLGFTQEEMGKQLGGYKLRTVQAWEAGERKVPQGVEKILSKITVGEWIEWLSGSRNLESWVVPNGHVDVRLRNGTIIENTLSHELQWQHKLPIPAEEQIVAYRKYIID